MLSFFQVTLFLSTFRFAVSECPKESLTWNNFCYFFSASNSSIAFYEAEFNCIGISGHLVSIHDAFTNGLLDDKAKEHFHESTMSDFWIGLNKFEIPGNWSWTDSSSFDFKDWAPSEPSNLSLNCASMNLDEGNWHAVDCNLPKPYICEVEKSIYETVTIPPTTTLSPTHYPSQYNCSSGYYYYAPTHSCYGINWPYNQNWSESEINCEKQKGHLASFHSYEEADFLSFPSSVNHDGLWVGLYTINSGASWVWSDGSPTNYLPWASGQPINNGTNNCAYIYRKFLYSNNCNDTPFSVCRKPVV
jgi:C-type mannose receptor